MPKSDVNQVVLLPYPERYMAQEMCICVQGEIHRFRFPSVRSLRRFAKAYYGFSLPPEMADRLLA